MFMRCRCEHFAFFADQYRARSACAYVDANDVTSHSCSPFPVAEDSMDLQLRVPVRIETEALFHG
jgi:hypothetical protein